MAAHTNTFNHLDIIKILSISGAVIFTQLIIHHLAQPVFSVTSLDFRWFYSSRSTYYQHHLNLCAVNMQKHTH